MMCLVNDDLPVLAEQLWQIVAARQRERGFNQAAEITRGTARKNWLT